MRTFQCGICSALNFVTMEFYLQKMSIEAYEKCKIEKHAFERKFIPIQQVVSTLACLLTYLLT